MQRQDLMDLTTFGLPAIVLAAPPMPAFLPMVHDVSALDSDAPARRLPGEVGYLNPHGLTAADLAEALSDLADTRALILDLRSHAGGDADAVLLGHLSWRPIPMATISRSRDGITLTRWTGKATAPEGGPHYPERPLFVLTASAASLAAQALTYDLRMAGRAVIVSGNDAFTLAWRRALSGSRRA